jgi:hypothetical protein
MTLSRPPDTEAFLGREVTNVRTSWIMVRAQAERIRRAPPRRARVRFSAIEMLEGRGLLSLASPFQSTLLKLPDGDRAPAVVELSASDHRGDLDTSTQTTAGSKISDPARAGRPSTGIPPGQSTSARTGSGGSGAIRRSTPSNSSERELEDSLALEQRTTDVDSGESLGDPPPFAPDVVFALGGGDISDPSSSSVVGWAPDAAMPVIVSPANLSGRAVGPDGRLMAGAGASAATAVPPGSSGTIVAVPESSATALGGPGTASGSPGDKSWAHSIAAAASGPESPTSAWAGLLDGAIRADWEAVDGELRQFLARLGALADSPDGRRSGPAWPFWIGAATALLVVRRASNGRRPLFRRPITGETWGSGHRPIPVGPWPLESP